MQSLLIKDTTRAQREEIVRRALSVCGSPCDGCSGCGNLGGGRVDEIYRPYIDGEKELAEINAEYAASRTGEVKTRRRLCEPPFPYLSLTRLPAPFYRPPAPR